MDLKTANWRNLNSMKYCSLKNSFSIQTMLLWFSFIVCFQLSAQQKLLVFPADIDSAAITQFYADKTIDLSKCDNPELYFEVYRWNKTHYQYGGNSTKGIDCSHFVAMLYSKIYGIKLNSSSAAIYLQCKTIKGGIKDAAEGDLLFFIIKKKHISHIAVYLQHGKFAHASTHAGVIVSDMEDSYYKKHFYKVGRIEE